MKRFIKNSITIIICGFIILFVYVFYAFAWMHMSSLTRVFSASINPLSVDPAHYKLPFPSALPEYYIKHLRREPLINKVSQENVDIFYFAASSKHLDKQMRNRLARIEKWLIEEKIIDLCKVNQHGESIVDYVARHQVDLSSYGYDLEKLFEDLCG